MRALILLLCAGSLFGQRMLYNKDLDKQGQDAAKAAVQIASQPLTDKELENSKIIESQEIEATLNAGFLNMRTQIHAFDSWDRVSRSVCKTLRMLYAENELAAAAINADVARNRDEFDETCTVQALTREKSRYDNRSNRIRALYSTDVATRLNELSGEIRDKGDRLKEAAKTRASAAGTTASNPVDSGTESWVNSAVDRAGDVRQLLELARTLNPKINVDAQAKALQQIEDGMKEVGALIETVNEIWNSYRDVAVDPRSLAPSKDKLAASLLAIEADRLKERTAIRSRYIVYLADLETTLEDCVAKLNELHFWYSRRSVEDSINSSRDQNDRVKVLIALHLATAGAVANQTPFGVQALRDSITESRYSLRRDAIYNGAYEQALKAAGQRLTAYYGSGVKPTQVASLLYLLSGIVSLPKLAF